LQLPSTGRAEARLVARSASRSTTWRPARASLRAIARPTTPPPITAESSRSLISWADCQATLITLVLVLYTIMIRDLHWTSWSSDHEKTTSPP
jgi:hypothetical protein